ncbi:MAG: hypothetical protein R3E64_04180 [Halioglobus sp.]
MQRVRSMVNLVAQREALLRLESREPYYTVMHQNWLACLHPAEREALKAYDEMVERYVRTAPLPVQQAPKVATLH